MRFSLRQLQHITLYKIKGCNNTCIIMFDRCWEKEEEEEDFHQVLPISSYLFWHLVHIPEFTEWKA